MRLPTGLLRLHAIGDLNLEPFDTLDYDMPSQLDVVVADWSQREAALASANRLGSRAALMLWNVPNATSLHADGPRRIIHLPTARNAEHLRHLVATGLQALIEGISVVSSPGSQSVKSATVLGRRERQILTLLADGRANKEIAAALRISEGTVKFHLSEMFAKLGASNRAQAVRRGMESGLLEL